MPTHRTKFEIDADTRKLESKFKGVTDSIKSVGQRIRNFFQFEVVAGFTAAYLALTRLYDKMVDMAQLASDKLLVHKPFEKLTKEAGLSATQALGRLREAVKGTASDVKLMQRAAQAMDAFTSSGLGAGQAFEATQQTMSFLYRYSIKFGKDFNQLMQTVFTGLQRGSVQFLDDVGIMIDGTSKEFQGLNEVQKKAKIVQISLGEMAKKNKLLGEVGESVTGSLLRQSASMENLSAAIGERFLPRFQEMQEGYQNVIDSALRFIEIPTSEKLEKEQIELNGLVGALVNAWDNQKVRNYYIDELNQNYPEFLKNINLEKGTTQDLIKQLQIANQEYVKRIEIQIKQEELNEIIRKRVDLQKQQAELLKRINMIYMNTMGANANIAATVEEKIRAINLQLALSKDRFMPGFGMQTIQVNDLMWEYNRTITGVNEALKEEAELLEEAGNTLDTSFTPKVEKSKQTIQSLSDQITKLRGDLSALSLESEEIELLPDVEVFKEDLKDVTQLAVDMGEALGGAVQEKGLKESLKRILNTFVQYLQLKLLITKGEAIFKTTHGDVSGWLAVASLAALLEALKIQIASFAVGVEYFKGGFARVHKDEITYMPKGSDVYNKREAAAMFDTSRIEGLLQTLISVTASNQAGRKTLDIYTLTNMIEKEKSKRL